MPWNDEATKQGFLRRANEGTESFTSLCATFGITRQTGYRWKREAVARTSGKEKRQPIRARKLGEVEVELLLDQIREHPAYSCHQYADALGEAGINLSSTTIQKKLNEFGLGLRKNRLLAVEERAARTGERPPPSAWRELRENQRPIEAINFRTQYPGEVIAMSSYRWTRQKTPLCWILLAMDLHTQTIRTELWDGSGFENAVLLYLHLTEFIRRRCFLDDPMRPAKDGTPYAKMGARQHRLITVKLPSTGTATAHPNWTAADSSIAYVLDEMKTTLFKKLESLVTTGDEKATQDAMQDWEWGFNTAHKNGGFPNFGLTPMQRVVAFSRGKA